LNANNKTSSDNYEMSKQKESANNNNNNEKLMDKRNRKKKDIDTFKDNDLPCLKSEYLETKIDFIDDISIYSFYDIESLKSYVKLNNLLQYENNKNNNNGSSSSSSDATNEPTRNSKGKFQKNKKLIQNDQLDCEETNYLKKLDDNLLDNDDLNISNNEDENNSQDSFKSSMIWQPTIKSTEQFETQKQLRKRTLKERNISITSSTFSAYSHYSESSRSSLSPDRSLPECGKAHCRLGCICDAISSSNNDNSSSSPTPSKNYYVAKSNEDAAAPTELSAAGHHQRDHCGRFECMFECNCTRRLRSSTRPPNSKTKNEEEKEETSTAPRTSKRQTLKKENSNSKPREQQQQQQQFSKKSFNHLRLNSKNKNNSNSSRAEHSKNNCKGTDSSSSSNKGSIRQSKRVKLLKKKSNLIKRNPKNKELYASSSFKDFYFYYDQDNKLSSLKSRNRNNHAAKKTKDEINTDFSQSDEDDNNNQENENEEEEQQEEEDNELNDYNNKNDSDFVIDKSNKRSIKHIKTTKTIPVEESFTKLPPVSKTPHFEPHTQNITLKIQSNKSCLNSVSFVSIPLRIEVFTPKWENMPHLNKKTLRLLAKLLQKLDVLNNFEMNQKNLKEIEFECDKEINVVVFAASHLKDCSNTCETIKDDHTKKPICIKVTKYNTNNKSLLTKLQLKNLLSEDLSNDQSNQILNLVLKKQEESCQGKKLTDQNSANHFTAKNIENIQKSGNFIFPRSLPRLLCRSRNKLNRHNLDNTNKPINQTNLIFKNVDSLLEKINLKAIDNLSKLSPQLTTYRPDFIYNGSSKQQNDLNYIFEDEIKYKDSIMFKENQNVEYPFYNPFVDESLILPMYKAFESRDLVDSVCLTMNDMIKVVSLYSENQRKLEKQTAISTQKPNIISMSSSKQKILEVAKRQESTKTSNFLINKTVGNENKTNFIIINPKSSTDASKEENDLGIPRKIVLPSTSMNFKTLVKIVSTKEVESKESLTLANGNLNQKIKISSSLLPSSPGISSVTTYSRSIFKTQPQITKILTTPIASSQPVVTSKQSFNTSTSISPPKIITLPLKTTSNPIIAPKIVSIASSNSSKSFIPIRPKNELNKNAELPSSSFNSLITNKPIFDLNCNRLEENNTQTNQYIESRKRKRKQDLSSLSSPVKSLFTLTNNLDSTFKSVTTNNDNIHLNILNKQINSIKNEPSYANLDNLSVKTTPTNKQKPNSNLNSTFKVSTSLFKHQEKPRKETENVCLNRANSMESLTDKDFFDMSPSSSSNLLNSLSQKATSSSESNYSPSCGKKTKILISKENESEEEILESDNSDFSDSETISKTKQVKKRKTQSKALDDDSSADSSLDDDYEDEFEKKIAKKLLSSNNNSSKPIVNNIHSIRERQRRFRLKKLLVKLKIVLYECGSNCKYDLENKESKSKLDEYFNQKNFKMKSKQNILQEVIKFFLLL